MFRDCRTPGRMLITQNRGLYTRIERANYGINQNKPNTINARIYDLPIPRTNILFVTLNTGVENKNKKTIYYIIDKT